jgi:hypothetical protein
MSNPATFEEIETLVSQLPMPEQLKLAARICERLSETSGSASAKDRDVAARLAEADAWLAECDAVAESIEGEFDSAEDIRQIREDRVRALCGGFDARSK